ncbi:MAG: helix-turn-helix transcriptional regulator [Oscillospiraceae bacterium]|nr:helix-turn-helix transcriptional regulator [Oscillospiraceae bacterium]
MKLSERLTELRKEKNLSQAELADALNVSRQSVSLWENGSTVPALDKLQFLAEFYGVTIDELFYPVEKKQKPQEQAASPQMEEKHKRKWFWLCAAAVVIVLLVGILIAAIGHKETTKEPTPIGELEGIVIETDRTQDFELE